MKKLVGVLVVIIVALVGVMVYRGTFSAAPAQPADQAQGQAGQGAARGGGAQGGGDFGGGRGGGRGRGPQGPMAIGLGEGGELQAPLARVVIGGLLASTIVTLVLVPSVYTLFEEGFRRGKTAEATGSAAH